MSDKWERKMAAELVMGRLQRECCKDAIVRYFLTAARQGEVDLLTALVECIKSLAAFREEMLAKTIRLETVLQDGIYSEAQLLQLGAHHSDAIVPMINEKPA